MTQFQVFVVRLIVGIVCAVVLSRVFHPEFHIARVMMFAAMLISLAYILEWWRRRKTGKKSVSSAPGEGKKEGGDHH